MLHKANPIPTPIMPSEKPAVQVQAPVVVPQPTPVPAPITTAAAPREEGWTGPAATVPVSVPARTVPLAPAVPVAAPSPFPTPDVDLRPMDPRLSRMGDQDLRVPPGAPVQPPAAVPRDPRENFIPEQ